jgi:ribonuclease D
MVYNKPMPGTRLPDPRLITRPADLERLAGELAREPILAVDTESNSLYAYRERVCLVQFSTPQADYLVDPLTLPDLSVLGEIFANPRIEKVFHAAEYDLIGMRRDFGFEFANLFDTMLAASILGKSEVGLATLLENEFGIRIDKRYQRANWGQRSLPEYLLDYARLDTHYLIPLRQRMHAELVASGRWALAADDFKRLCRLGERNHENGSKQPEGACWRISGASELTPRQAAVLQELCRYRHMVAESLNRPLFKVIRDETLLAIAMTCPRTTSELKEIPGITWRQLQRHGNALLQAVQRGLKTPPLHPPSPPRPDNGFLHRLDCLRRWRKTTAQQMGVKSDIVLPRDLMHNIAEGNPQGMSELAGILELSPWRLENYGKRILEIISRS